MVIISDLSHTHIPVLFSPYKYIVFPFVNESWVNYRRGYFLMLLDTDMWLGTKKKKNNIDRDPVLIRNTGEFDKDLPFELQLAFEFPGRTDFSFLSERRCCWVIILIPGALKLTTVWF